MKLLTLSGFIILVLMPRSISLTELEKVVIGTKTLTVQNSPYTSEEGLEIEEGSTLRIEAGVEVQFAPGRGVDVHGELDLLGNADNPVKFTIWEEKKMSYSQRNLSVPIRLYNSTESRQVKFFVC